LVEQASYLMASRPRHLLGTRAYALRFLLLTGGELPQAFERLVDPPVLLLALATLDLLVLVAKLVIPQLKQIGEILGVRLLASHATACLTLEAHLHFSICRLRAL
jgi:hypothetical protein